jgi:hypothetical protein
MSFDVEVNGHVQRTLYERLSELIGETAIHRCGRRVVLNVTDQSAMVALVAHLNDLGMQIEAIHRVPRPDSVQH